MCEGDRGGKTMDLGFVREVVGRKREIKVEEDGVGTERSRSMETIGVVLLEGT